MPELFCNKQVPCGSRMGSHNPGIQQVNERKKVFTGRNVAELLKNGQYERNLNTFKGQKEMV